jgi:hypothetical protein
MPDMRSDFENPLWLDAGNQMVQRSAIARINTAEYFAGSVGGCNSGVVFRKGGADCGIVHNSGEVDLRMTPQFSSGER